jgi:hypothetical protein
MQKANAPHYIVICGLFRLCDSFPNYHINVTIFEEKKMWKVKTRFFSLQYFIFLILIRDGRNIFKNVHRPPCEVPIILVRL